MSAASVFSIGDRVKLRGTWQYVGLVIETQEGVTAQYKIRWDDGGVSGWLSAGKLKAEREG